MNHSRLYYSWREGFELFLFGKLPGIFSLEPNWPCHDNFISYLFLLLLLFTLVITNNIIVIAVVRIPLHACVLYVGL